MNKTLSILITMAIIMLGLTALAFGVGVKYGWKMGVEDTTTFYEEVKIPKYCPMWNEDGPDDGIDEDWLFKVEIENTSWRE